MKKYGKEMIMVLVQLFIFYIISIHILTSWFPNGFNNEIAELMS